MRDTPLPSTNLLVACLCAQWCDVCGEYQTLFDRLASKLAAQVKFQWVDIEDHDEVLGAVEVDDFPTLLIARSDRPVFFGTVTTQAATLAHLVQSALDLRLTPLTDPTLEALAQRVHRFARKG